MRDTRSLSLRLSPELHSRLLSACGTGSVSGFVKKAIEERLSRVSGVGVSRPRSRPVSSDSTSQSSAGRSVLDTVGAFIRDNPDWLGKIPEDKQAQIISTIGLKLAQQSSDVDSDVLSLKSSISSLPSVSDLTQELSVLRGHLFKMSRERDLAVAMLQNCRDSSERKAFFLLLLEGVVEIIWQWIARNSVPGIGSGGGLTESGREACAEEASKWIEKNIRLF